MLIKLLGEHAPNAQLEFITAVPQEATDMLLKREIDLAFAPFSDVPDRLSKFLILEEEYVVVTSRSWSKTNGAMTLDKFCNARHVRIHARGVRDDPIENNYISPRFRRKVVATVPSYATAIQLVSHSDMLATIPKQRVLVTVGASRIVMHPAPIKLPRVPLSLAWNKAAKEDRMIAWLIEALFKWKQSIQEEKQD